MSNFYAGQVVYLNVPGSECVGRVRGWATDYLGTTYTVLWNDGSDGSFYAEELTTEKPSPVAE